MLRVEILESNANIYLRVCCLYMSVLKYIIGLSFCIFLFLSDQVYCRYFLIITKNDKCWSLKNSAFFNQFRVNESQIIFWFNDGVQFCTPRQGSRIQIPESIAAITSDLTQKIYWVCMWGLINSFKLISVNSFNFTCLINSYYFR